VIFGVYKLYVISDRDAVLEAEIEGFAKEKKVQNNSYIEEHYKREPAWSFVHIDT
jgi:hypothetical protein